MNSLKTKVKEVIEKTYNCELTCPLKVTKNDDLYKVLIYTNVRLPFSIGGQFDTDEEFLEYLCKELKESKRNFTKYYKIVRMDPEEIPDPSEIPLEHE